MNKRTKIFFAVLMIFGLSGLSAARTIGYWEFTQGANPAVLDDLSGNGNDGAITATGFFNGDGTALFSGDDMVVIEGNPDGNAATPGVFDIEDFKVTVNFRTESSYNPNSSKAMLGTRQADPWGFLIYLNNWGGAGSIDFWIASKARIAATESTNQDWYKLKIPSVLEASHEYTFECSLIAGRLGVKLVDHTDGSVDTAFATHWETGEEIDASGDYKFYPGGDFYIGQRGADQWGGNNLTGVSVASVKFETAPNLLNDDMDDYVSDAEMQSMWDNAADAVATIETTEVLQGTQSAKIVFNSADTITKKVVKEPNEIDPANSIFYVYNYTADDEKKFVAWFKGDGANVAGDITIDIVNMADEIEASATVVGATQETAWSFVEIPVAVNASDPNSWMLSELRITSSVPATMYFDDLGIVVPDAPPVKVVEWKFDETSGSVAADTSGNGFDGQLGSGFVDADWVAGKEGNALQFSSDDPNKYVDSGMVTLPTELNNIFDPSSSWTINQWVKLDSVNMTQLFGGFGLGIAGDVAVQRYLDSGSGANISFWGGGYDVTTGVAFDEEQWQMITITYDKWTQSLKFYKNAEYLGQIARTFETAEPYFRIGAIAGNATHTAFDGAIDNFCIWDQALPFSDEDADPTNDIISLWGSWVCDEKPEFDFDDNCVVDLGDFVVFAAKWLECGRYPETFCQ